MFTAARLWWLFVVPTLAVVAPAQLKTPDERPPAETPVMADEDEDFVAPTKYAFNPIQAKRELKVGDYYAKKGSYRAAVGRYLEAVRWNPSYADAYWKLGRSREKLNQPAQAIEAYRSLLGLEPSGKRAKQVRGRVAELEKNIEKLPMAAADSEARPEAPHHKP